jgi:hypothetical protein
LSLLARAGDASVQDARILLRNAVPGRTQRLAEEIQRSCPEAGSLLTLIDHAMGHMPSVLRGVDPGDNAQRTELWKRAAIWRHEPAMQRAADAVAVSLEQAFKIRPARINLHTIDRVSLDSIRAAIPPGSATIVTAPTRLETWEMLALAHVGATTLTFPQWEAVAREVRSSQTVIFPSAGSRTANIHWGVFALLSHNREGRNEQC